MTTQSNMSNPSQDRPIAVRAELHHGDCLDVMRGIPDQSVDAVVTDPPYADEQAKLAIFGGDVCR